MTTVFLEAGAVMNEEMLRLKGKAMQYFSDMHVEYAVVRGGLRTVEHVRVLNPEIGQSTTDEEFVDALVIALGRCPMPTMQSLQVRKVLTDARRCANIQA